MDQQQVAQPAKVQSHVEYLPGISIVGAKPALLEWTADDRIRFFIFGADGVTAIEVLLDIPVGQIEFADASMNMIVLTVAGKKYRAYFTQAVSVGIGVGGVAGIAAAKVAQDASGVAGWAAMFKRAGVKGRFRGVGRALKIALCIVGAIILLGIVWFAL